jgi:hypothetical protein
VTSQKRLAVRKEIIRPEGTFDETEIKRIYKSNRSINSKKREKDH